MIEIHSIFGLCVPVDMSLADIEHNSIPETDTPGIIETNGSDGNADIFSGSGKSKPENIQI